MREQQNISSFAAIPIAVAIEKCYDCISEIHRVRMVKDKENIQKYHKMLVKKTKKINYLRKLIFLSPKPLPTLDDAQKHLKTTLDDPGTRILFIIWWSPSAWQEDLKKKALAIINLSLQNGSEVHVFGEEWWSICNLADQWQLHAKGAALSQPT